MDLLPDLNGSESESMGEESAADGMDGAVDRAVIDVGTHLSLPHVKCCPLRGQSCLHDTTGMK